MNKLKILVVEDDDALRDALSITLEAAGHAVTGAAGGQPALAQIESRDFHMVVSDLRMAPMDGLQLLGEIRRRRPNLPVLLMTAFGDVDKAVAAMRGGACDFMLKPFEPRDLLAQIERYAIAPAAEGVVAEDPLTREVLLLAARVARTDATVMLTGESGTGKEVFARYIHDQSARAAGPFVAINCAAIPDNLLEATLFGHEKGAFTGAQAAQAGKFEQADGGTLLLDEISEMPLALQAKLLRVLQEREVERVGGRKPVPIDIRVLATSNRDMAEEVRQHRFREDLYYRLNVFPLHIPSLRERSGDILPLARHFLGIYGARNGRHVALSPGAAAKLAAHGWPGNVRELENVVQRALILASGDTVEADHLLLARHSTPPPSVIVPAQPAPLAVVAEERMESISSSNMKDLERQHILDTLSKVGGSRKKAVELLGISERTLRYKLAQYRDEGHIENE
ncbi:sigma-54-dependent Fis family transcriptional regulator [Denitratisoma sp. DHT3]|uniref:sigma-54-dependent transcriptional regulator n=1 Tax=Denitratisoma sp. DHT3 TaxID=1981880 RepID=UPI0011987E88|nr:sigma-54 dependent transcriptional regulator [Denitratisoma sp. DHT3]QDX81344.1 sigma-54-dependent Fis family transcriptional regulator [Denitratisoma sp. DHT3]